MSRAQVLPTYQEIAKKAGVSTKTVCNVFRYPDLVREKTASRVLKALRQMGIEDSSAMKMKLRPARLPQGRSLLLLESAPSGAMSTPVYSKIMVAAEVRAHELGWQLSVRHKDPGEDLSKALRHFRGEGVILFKGSTSNSELSAVLPGIAAVRVLSSPESGHDCDSVDYDRAEVPRLAAQYLADNGCRRVAFIGTFFDGRGAAFVTQARKLGLEAMESNSQMLIAHNGVQVVYRPALIDAWEKAAGFKPDGVFVESDQITNALHAVLSELGIRPERDLKIVSCNAEELFLGPLDPRPASIDIHSAEIGRKAIDLLIARIENRTTTPSSLVLRPKLLAGEALSPSSGNGATARKR